MVERHRFLDFLSHGLLALGVSVIVFPIYLALVGSTHSAQEMAQSPIPLWFGQDAMHNHRAILLGEGPGVSSQVPVARMMWVSLVTALSIAFGKIVISLLSAFAIVYFNFPFRKAVFWGIFITLMLPVEVRIVPTYKVVADFGMINSFAGLTVPLIASATATFLFRQFFLTVPDELTEAAKMDGASPMRFFWDVLLPLSRTSMAALFVIQFIYGWNQYLWPLLMSTEERMYPIVMGIRSMTAGADSQVEWNLVMATAILAMLPPALVVVLMQKWFVKGLVDTEK
jgi:sn-glycerol 3-phosphate transport system permease protein